MSTDKILTETVKELSYSTARSDGFGSDLPDDTEGFTNTDGAGDGHGGLIKVLKDTTEVTSINRDTCKQERFVSIIEKRKLERRFEEEMEINWEKSERVNEENMASKVDNLLSKLKSRFSEEKEARKYAVKQNRSYFNFCNSVDAFLRHVEKPKVDIKYSERDDDLQGEGVYSFSVRPASIKRRNVKASSFESTKIDGVSYTDAVKETTSIEEEVDKSIDDSRNGKGSSFESAKIDGESCTDAVKETTSIEEEEVEKNIDESGNGKGIHELCKDAKDSHVANTGNSLPLDKAVNLPATLPSIYMSRNDHANAAPIADDNLLLQVTDDSGRNISFATMGNYYGLLRSKEVKPFVCANFTYDTARPFPRILCPGYMSMVVKEKHLPEMYFRGQSTRTSIYTNSTRFQFRRIIPVLNRKCLMYKINMSVPSKHLNKRVRCYAEQFLVCLKSKQNVYGSPADDIIYPKYALPVYGLLPVYGFMTFKTVFGIISVATISYFKTEQGHALNNCINTPSSLQNARYMITENCNAIFTNQNLPTQQPTLNGLNFFGHALCPENYDTKHREAKSYEFLKPSLEGEHVTNYVTSTADDKNVPADDNETTEYERIIDESEDAGPFGIMSIYSNSEIHNSRYDNFPADDTWTYRK